MIEGQEGVTWEQWLALAAACERHGLEGLFRSDHYLSFVGGEGRGSLDAWATLAGLAAVTERIRLGTMVSPATFRHPSQLARVATTVDHISGGRVELGLGGGWNEREHRAHGFEFPDTPTRLDLFAEQLELIHRQLTEEGLDFSGRFYTTERLTALPRPVQTPRMPIIVGGRGFRRTVEPAVRLADEYNTAYVSPDEAAEKHRFLEEVCGAQGRDPATIVFSLMTGCVIGRDEAEVDARVARLLEQVGEGMAAGFLSSRSESWLIGTVDDIRDRLLRHEEAGVERVFLQHLDHADLDAVELIGELASAT